MATFMVVHKTQDLSWEEVEKKWIKLAREQSALWVRTWFNRNEGVRYCEWNAPNAKALEEIFARHEVDWRSILEVEKTSPGSWRWVESPLSSDKYLDTEE